MSRKVNDYMSLPLTATRGDFMVNKDMNPVK